MTQRGTGAERTASAGGRTRATLTSAAGAVTRSDLTLTDTAPSGGAASADPSDPPMGGATTPSTPASSRTGVNRSSQRTDHRLEEGSAVLGVACFAAEPMGLLPVLRAAEPDLSLPARDLRDRLVAFG